MDHDNFITNFLGDIQRVGAQEDAHAASRARVFKVDFRV